jgi:squalene-hopene/tetraprenyl-beta-curcumene cyclase
MTQPDTDRLRRAYAIARDALLAERTLAGHWIGELSTSALSTAVAVSALSLVHKAGHGSFDSLIQGGLRWLAEHQNADGGWGDTVKSLSNISTTMLCRAAVHLSDRPKSFEEALRKSEGWLAAKYGRTQEELAEAVRRRYGKDRTFSVPILMTSALAGLVSWSEVPSLPFELACFPQSWFHALRLPVVSYALPALIAIGQAVHHHRPSWNPLVRLTRSLARQKSLRVLEAIQPSNGGFLEATPLTAFVALALSSCGQAGHPVTGKCMEFLVASVRPDGSWPIDTNLSTWVTTLAVNALAAAGELEHIDRLDALEEFLRLQQHVTRHPYTGAEPGAWAWTDLPGGVPDADDTPGACIALQHLTLARQRVERRALHAAYPKLRERLLEGNKGWTPADLDRDTITVPGPGPGEGLAWLLRLQNSDGGWPTFCRGWTQMPFDRSGADLTAHALRAFAAWKEGMALARFRLFTDIHSAGWRLPHAVKILTPENVAHATERGLAYLARNQRSDGSWLPLWFGNQHAPDDVNPTYGTARVLAAYRDLGLLDSEPARRGLAWLVGNQNADGGWGGCAGTPSSIEETALAVEVLLGNSAAEGQAAGRGLAWLIERVEAGELAEATPIGFYFAKLWYFEKLYPIVFTVAALGRACRALGAP